MKNDKKNVVPQVISEEEQKVLELESRRNTAESGIASASEAKRVIEKKIQVIEENISLRENDFKKINNDIKFSISRLAEIQASVADEGNKFEDAKRDNKLTLKKEQDEIDALVEKKRILVSEIAGITRQHENNKASKKAELEELKRNKDFIVNEIAVLEKEKAEVIKKKDNCGQELIIIESEISKKISEKTTLEGSISSLVNEKANQEVVIKTNNESITRLNDEISDKEKEIISLDGTIEVKKAEIKSIDQRAFNLNEREDVLEQKKAFIKDKYERAGVPWDE